MFYINEEIYYHINTGDRLKKGQLLESGNKYNNFYHEMYNTEYIIDEKDANQYLLEMKKNKKYVFFSDEIAELVYKTVNDSAMITREFVFEEVRKQINEELPSRLKCLYVCKTREEIDDWIQIFKRSNKKHYQIIKLKLTGKIFCGDASFILRENISLSKKKKQAKLYWNGCKKNNINEYLFEGKAIVEEIIDL